MKYITHAFSLQMLRDPNAKLEVSSLSQDEFYRLAKDGRVNIGNQEVAELTGLGFNRAPIVLLPGDVALVAMICGGKHANEWPEKCLEYYMVQIQEVNS